MKRNLRSTVSAAICGMSLTGFVCLLSACGPGGTYTRLTNGSGGGFGSGGDPGGDGGAGSGGTGGMLDGSGGSGGVSGSGGAGAGGMASGGRGTGGAGTGGMGRGGTGGGGAGSGGTGMGGAAGPRILSIDFVGGVPGAMGGVGGIVLTPTPMAPTEVAGVKMAANWNSAPSFMGSLPDLELSDGTPTTASVTWNAPPVSSNVGTYSVGLADAPGNARMMNGYLDPTAIAMPAMVTVSGLPTTITSGGYDVYVYTLGHLAAGSRTYSYAIGPSTVTVSQTAPSPATVPAFVLAPNTREGNYVIFRNMTASSFTLSATPETGTPRAPVNGIQIVSPTGS